MVRRNLRRLIEWSLSDDCPPVTVDNRGYAERTWRFTRALSLISFALALLSSVVTFVFLATIWTVNNEFVRANPKFKFDEDFDAIAAAAAIGRLDLVAMILTFVGVVAAFSIIYGWTAFRSVAIDAAKAETKDRVPLELRSIIDAEGDRLVGLALQDAELLAKIQQGLTVAGLDDTETAGQVDDEPEWTYEVSNEQGTGTAPPVSPADTGERGGARRKSWLERLFGR